MSGHRQCEKVKDHLAGSEVDAGPMFQSMLVPRVGGGPFPLRELRSIPTFQALERLSSARPEEEALAPMSARLIPIWADLPGG